MLYIKRGVFFIYYQEALHTGEVARVQTKLRFKICQQLT